MQAYKAFVPVSVMPSTPRKIENVKNTGSQKLKYTGIAKPKDDERWAYATLCTKGASPPLIIQTP